MLQLKNITKSFGGKPVAKNISLSVGRGRLLAVLGKSGCGKSTLLNIVAGLIHADSGEVWLGEGNITDRPSEKRNISLMFQDYALFPHLNVVQNAAFGLRMRGIPAKEAERLARDALAEVGLEHNARRDTGSLSGGEKQRLALARALVTHPDLLLLDEAFSSLDTHLRTNLREQTLSQIRRQNIPAVLVTHDPEEAFTLADEIALMAEGRILQHGTPAELLQKPAGEEAARLLGLSNVGKTCYIPQRALAVCRNGEEAADRIVRITELPDCRRIVLAHHRYGRLVVDLERNKNDWPAALSEGSRMTVTVDEEQIVRFLPEGGR